MPSGRLSEAEVVDYLKTAVGNPAAIGDTQLVAAPNASFKIVVYGYQVLAGGGANNVLFRSNTNPISSVKGLAANGGISVPPGVMPLFECNGGEALNVNLSAATAVGVDVQFALARV